MNQEYETTIMELIVHAGDARSLATQAIRSARKGNFAEAKELISQCDEAMIAAHEAQTGLIRSELEGKPVAVTLLMVHAQDHVMNAMTVIDLAKEMISMMEEKSV